jgi:hypothetical protein
VNVWNVVDFNVTFIKNEEPQEWKVAGNSETKTSSFVYSRKKKSRGVRWEEWGTKRKGRLCFPLSVGTLDPRKPHLGCNVQMQSRLFVRKWHDEFLKHIYEYIFMYTTPVKVRSADRTALKTSYLDTEQSHWAYNNCLLYPKFWRYIV